LRTAKTLCFIIVLAISLILVGCAKTPAPQDPPNPVEIDIWEEVPELEILFTADDGSSSRIPTVRTQVNWNFVDEDGNGTGVIADSPPPHQIDYGEDNTIDLKGAGGGVELHFSISNPPNSISAERIDAVFLFSNQDDVYENYETVPLIDNRFRVDSDGQDYIYVIDAEWNEGNSTGRSMYSFRVNS
jgi:hypothetical protein